MFPLSITMHLRNLLIVILISLACAQERLLKAKLNPNCDDCDSTSTLLYVKGVGSEDIIHQIWDFTRGSPTVIYAVGSPNSSMTITWHNKEPTSFKLSGSLIYSFAAEIDKLYDYEDCRDAAQIDVNCTRQALPLRYVSWKLNNSVLTSEEVMLSMHGVYKQNEKTGIVNMKLDLLPFEDYAKDLPHLIHTANSTLIDISLVNFTTWSNSSRYAIHLVMVSTDSPDDNMVYSMRKSLDDEHTPGVFEIIEVKTPKSSGLGGYLQCRPVAYSEADRSVSSSTNAYISTFNSMSLSNYTTLGRFYNKFNYSQVLVQYTYISFGLPGDGYYKQHNYTSWSFTLGYGSPPVESVSTFVVVIIVIGLGVPVLLALSGIAYVLVRRYKQRRNQPERFIDDDDE